MPTGESETLELATERAATRSLTPLLRFGFVNGEREREGESEMEGGG